MNELIEYTNDVEEVVPAVIRRRGKLYCRRCNNHDRRLFYKDDIGYYCENCLTFGKSSDYRKIRREKNPPLPRVHPSLTKPITLSDLQAIASQKCVQAYNKGYNYLVFAVTGAGKTEIVYEVIMAVIKDGKRVCFATPRKDVVLELLPRFQRDFNNIEIVALYGGSPDRGKDGHLIISTTHQLIHYYHFFDLVILDEVDAFPFYNNETLEFFVQKAKRPQAPIIYLTATPTEKLKRLMRNKQLHYYIIPSRFHKHPIPVPKVNLLSGISTRLSKGKLHPNILSWLREKERIKKQVFLFVPSLNVGEQLEQIMRNLSFNCQFVSSKSPNRKDIVGNFREGALQFIITTTILERGVTVPYVDVCIVLACDDIFDERAIVQIVGRAGRAKDHPYADVRLFCEDYTKGIKQAIRHIKMMNRRNERLKKENKPCTVDYVVT